MNRGWAVMNHKSRATTVVFFTVLLFMLATLVLYAYLGTFTRYMADDYSTASVLNKEGFWGAQVYWWQTWSGRYSFTFVISFIELFGLGIVPILPTLIILPFGRQGFLPTLYLLFCFCLVSASLFGAHLLLRE